MVMCKYFIILIGILVSCSGDKYTIPISTPDVEFNVNSIENILVKKIVIESEENLGSYNKIFFEESGNITYDLIAYDNSVQIIDFFDIGSRKLLNRISLLSNPIFFKNLPIEMVYNNQLIYLFSSGGLVVKMDDQGKILETFNFSKDLRSTKSVLGIDPLNNNESLIPLDSGIIVRSYPNYNWHEDYKYYENPSAVFINNNFDFQELFGFPQYMSSNKSQYFVNDYRYSFVLHENKILISYRRDPSIYSYDLFEKTFERFPSKSGFINDFELIERKYNPQKETNILITSGIYHNLYHDKFEKKIYRIVSHSQPLKNEDGYLNNAGFKNFSIIVHDFDLNYIGESFFSKKLNYSYLKMAVSKEGLIFINKNSNEKKLEIDIYKFN
jgi:hypothetical protein